MTKAISSLHIIIIALSVIFCLTPFVYADNSSDESVSIAILADKTYELHNSPLISLLEVKLSEKKNIQLLERAEINTILKEQKLQLMFSGQGGKDRVAAGKLLKADLLILLRSKEKNGIRSLDVIVAETKSGLRLLVRTIPWSGDPTADVEKVNGLISRAFEKYQQGIELICAVPPFVSNDLSHKYDYLQRAYAKYIEQVLLQVEGVVVVELQEAQAISRELGLTSSISGVKRNLPVYILGEYRNEGVGDNQKLNFKISFRQGQRIQKIVNQKDVLAEDVGAFIRKHSLKVLEFVSGKKQLVSDPEIEFEILTKKAEEFTAISSWREAIDLTEAALLLKPYDIDLHYNLVYLIKNFILAHPKHKSNDPRYAQSSAEIYNYYRQGLQHYEILLYTNIVKESRYRHIKYYIYRYNRPRGRMCMQCMLKLGCKRCIEIDNEVLELIHRVLNDKVESNTLDDHFAKLFIEGQFMWLNKSHLTEKQKYAHTMKYIKLFKDLPQASEWVEYLGMNWWPVSVRITPGYMQYIDEIEKIDSPKVRVAVAALCLDRDRRISYREQGKQRTQRPKKTSVEKPDGDYDITFTKINFESRSDIIGFKACGNNIDIAWSLYRFFLMKEKGRVECLGNERLISREIEYDGKYIWPVIQIKAGAVKIMVIDPETEKTIGEFGESDGLPSGGSNCVAALGPGRVLVAGGITGRGWCGILEISESGEKKVEIFHEARIRRPEYAKKGVDLTDPSYAFYPTFIQKIFDPNDKSNRRVVIGRSTESYPLIIDPDSKLVKVLPLILNRRFTSHKGQMYWMDNYRGMDRCISSLGIDGVKENLSLDPLPNGHIIFADGQVHIAGEKWLTAKSVKGPFVEQSVKAPRGDWYHRRFYYSNHYGWVLVTHKQAYKIEF